MRKILIIILALCVLLGMCAAFAACNSGGPDETTGTAGTMGTESTQWDTESSTTEAPFTTTESQTSEDTTEPQTSEDTTDPITQGTGSDTSDTVNTEDTAQSSDTESDTDASDTTEAPTVEMPEAGSTLTIQEAIALSALLDNKTFTEGKYYVCGTVSSVYIPTNGSMTIVDAEGNLIDVKVSFSSDGEVGYAEMSEKPDVGDSIVVFGIIGRSGPSTQMKNVWIIEFGGDEQTEPTTPDTTEPTTPDTTEPTISDTTEPTTPDTTEPTTPDTTEPTIPDTTEPTTPDTTEPTTPDTTEPTTPDTTEPTTPDTTEPTTPDTTEPTTPDTTELTTPDTTEPTTSDTVEGETVIVDGIVYPHDPDIETAGKAEEDDGPTQGSTSCHPRYAYDAGYHWSPACDITTGSHTKPKAAGPKTLHELYCVIEDEGDVIVYSYTCRRCEYTTCRMEVPYDATMYIDPTVMSEAENNFGSSAVTAVTVDGFAASRFTSVEGSGDHVVVYEDNSNTLSTGKYMIVRIKLGNGRSGFRVAISSTNAYSANSTGDPLVYATVGGFNSGWTTAIIDISKLVEGQLGYTPSANGEYYLHKAAIYVDGMTKGTSFDLGYVAFCETLEDAKAFAAQDGAVYVYDDLMLRPTPCEKLGQVCNHEYEITNDVHSSAACPVCLDPGGEVAHNYLMLIEKNSEGKVTKYGGSCICGRAAPEKNITDDINFFSMPGQLYNRWNTGGLVKTYVRTGSVMSDGEQMFTRVTLQEGASFRVTDESVDYKGDDTAYPVTGGSGRYAVFRLRSSGTNQVMIWIDDGKTPGWKDNQCMGRTGDDVISGEWHTYVIDFQTSTYKFYKTMDETTTELKIGFKAGLAEGAVDPYIDLAYFAICDSWEEVAKVAGNETLYYTPWVGATPIVEVNKQGKCINEHMPKLDSSVAGKLRYYCYVCEKELTTLNVSENINYFSAPSQQINNWATSNVPSEGGDCQNVYTDLQGTKAWLTDLRYDETHGVYTRVNLYMGASFYAATTTSSLANRNDKPANDASVLITDPLASGEGCGQYLVFKMRSINNGTVSIQVSTNTGKNYGMAHRVETTDIMSGEFHTYVIDTGIIDPDATGVRVLIKSDSGQALKGACIDIAYLAIVDDWDEVAEIAANEDVVNYTTWYNGAPLIEKTPDGKCSQHVPIFQSSTNGTTYYNCSACGGVQVLSLSTPENVNYYSVPGLTYNNWSTGSDKNTAIGRHNLLYFDETDGFMYSRIRMFMGGSFELSNGSVTPIKGLADCSDVISGGSGKYLVFKIRFAESVEYLRLLLADGKKATAAGGEMRGSSNGTLLEQGGEWIVYVVDIEKMNSTAYGVNDSSVTNVTFGFQGESGDGELDGTEYIDFAYFAVCDNWQEIKAVVGEKDKVIYTAWNKNDFDEIRTSDGNPIPTDVSQE